MELTDNSLTRRQLIANGGCNDGRTHGERRHKHLRRAETPTPTPPLKTWAGQPFGNGLLTGKVAVITGAARGIGRAIAVDMAANGADIVAIDICAKILKEQGYAVTTPEDLKETGRLVQQHGRKCLALTGDVRDMPSFAPPTTRPSSSSAKSTSSSPTPPLSTSSRSSKTEDWEFNGVIENNLIGTANTIRAFAPGMVQRGQGGRIIVLSSMQGKHGSKNMASYSASKWGIIGLMKSAALELGPNKITVNALIPGLVDTPLTRNPARWSALISEVTANHEPAQKSHRAGDLEHPRTPHPTACRVAQAGRSRTRRRLPGLRSRSHGHRRLLRRDRRRRRPEPKLTEPQAEEARRTAGLSRSLNTL